MTNINQFESVFKAADKPQFSPETIEFESVTVVTDLTTTAGERFREDVGRFLGKADDSNLRIISGERFKSIDDLLQDINQSPTDLICTHRNLQIQAPEHPYSLGMYVDVLTQVTAMPVMLLPNPHTERARDFSINGRDAVMAITDHLTGDHHLVSFSARMTASGGTLFLTHVEDETTFDRYIETISRIPEIDTETARETIMEQLLKRPHDYIRSCREVLQRTGVPLTVEEIVSVGQHLADYKRLIDEHEIDLLVLNTKDEDQLAMHGLAYPLAVELRETPLLLL